MKADESAEERNLRLAAALRDHREDALEEILRLYGSAVIDVLHSRYSKCLGVLSYEDIEDVVSIALRRLWEARSRYDSNRQSLRAWFYCIADNVAKDVLKHGWHKARSLECADGHEWIETNASQIKLSDERSETGHDEGLASKKAADVEGALDSLSPEQRTIVLADAASGDGVASNEYLAQTLRIPQTHVRVYRSRAYAALRKELRKRGYDIP